jgi:hypothetical protein
MNVILHGNGKEIRMHHTDTDQVQQRLTVPMKIFGSLKNKWASPTWIEKNLVYKFSYHDGSYYHYQLEADKKN